MSIRHRGKDTYLVRVFIGRDAITKKRIDINRTVRGTLATAKKVEAQLKGLKASKRLSKPSQITLNILLDNYLDSARHVQSEITLATVKCFLNLYVRPYLGDIPINRINTRIVQELFNFLLDKKDGRDNARNI